MAKLGRKAIVAGINPLVKDSESTAPIVGFDTEYTRKRQLVCWQLSDGESASLHTGRLNIETLAAALRAYIGDAREVWVITFWSYAELQFLPTIAKSFDWQLYAAGSFDCVFQSKAGLTIRFFDIARFFERTTLYKVAESFGEEKIRYNVKNVTKRNLRDKRFIEYAKHDARLAARICHKLREQFLSLGVDPLLTKTAAGTSAAVFRRVFVKSKHRTRPPAARKAGMLAAWGGRAEALARGHFPFVAEYDLESAYPRAALSIGTFPTGDSFQESDKLRDFERYNGLAKVRFEFPADCAYPCLPVVTKSAQLYPLSGFSWATSFELRRAIELKAKVDIIEGWRYKTGTSELSDMMAWALEMRKGATGARKVAAKLMANSLIGKLAQRRSGFDIEEIRELAETERVDIHDLVQLSPAELESLGLERQAKVGACFMPEWNALITGHVRARLNTILCETSPVYCATDSVWTTERIPNPPPDLTLKREGAGVVIRTRLAAIVGEDWTHLAHHSVWTRRAGMRLVESLGAPLDAPRRIRYYSRRAVKLRETLRRRIRLGTFLKELRLGDSSWDEKRRLLPSGATEPWPDTETYLNARKTKWDAHRKS